MPERNEQQKRPSRYSIPFAAIERADNVRVGGKNASLAEMIRNLSAAGVRVPNGFAITTDAYHDFLEANDLPRKMRDALDSLNGRYSNLSEVSMQIRSQMYTAFMPQQISNEILAAYRELSHGDAASVAVRSSGTAEDTETASFAGQHDSYLNIQGDIALLEAVKNCFASLFTERAIEYREHHKIDHASIGFSVGVQCMVRSDKGASGVGFTIDPDTGFDRAMIVTGTWGLGDNIVQGVVTPDEFVLFKPALERGKRAVISKKLGTKEQMQVYDDAASTNNIDTPEALRDQYVLTDSQLEELGRWMLAIERHYGRAMDIEWALDGISGELSIVQARPETVRSQEHNLTISEYELLEEGKLLAQGIGVGNKIVTGTARVLSSPSEQHLVQSGDILVTDITSPDWDPVLRRAGAIITNKGGRTSHAAIVAREFGTPAVVGAVGATEAIADGAAITVVCSSDGRGEIYNSALKFERYDRELEKLQMPRTKPMMIIADPQQAFRFSFYPNQGVGLLRLEFIITNAVQVHPMALVNYPNIADNAKPRIEELTRGYDDKKEYFVEKLAEGVATIAAAFFPKDVIVRMSDFKTNEYAGLIGGAEFEPHEENPMIGFRGASRYYDDRYRAGFELECLAMKRVRDEMGLTNVKLMIPFCRTVEEGRKVIAIMEEMGLRRDASDPDAPEIYVMAELPSNVVLARQFAEIFDGFSIGSNDLTQLTLGLDRDSATVSELFDERNEAPKAMIATMIESAKACGRKIGLCGQAASDHAEFAEFLVTNGIDSISFNPDALLKGIENINEAERRQHVLSKFSTNGHAQKNGHAKVKITA